MQVKQNRIILRFTLIREIINSNLKREEVENKISIVRKLTTETIIEAKLLLINVKIALNNEKK